MLLPALLLCIGAQGTVVVDTDADWQHFADMF